MRLDHGHSDHSRFANLASEELMTYASRLNRPAWAKFYPLSVGWTAFAVMTSAAVNPATVRIHYNRTAADYSGWQLYTWYGALNPSPQWNPAQPPDGADTFGVFFDVPAITIDTGLNFILHDVTVNIM